jgi:AMME syndrome candidate gene 1 protein
VAVEQGWSKEETLDSLMRKAGWDGGGSGAGSGGAGSVARRFLRATTSSARDRGEGAAAGVAKLPWEEVADFRAVRYTGLKASASYGEWREWRSWVERRNGGVLR